MRTFKKPEQNGDFIVAPEGTTPAVLVGLAFLGWHKSDWQGTPRNRELVGLAWELTEPADDGRALGINEVLTLSFHEKAKLYQRVKALCGGKEPPEGFDLRRLLNSPGCLLTITHRQDSDLTFANIEQASPLPRGMNPNYQPSITRIFYDIKEYDEATFSQLPMRFKRLINDATLTPSSKPARQPATAAPPAPAPTRPPAAAPLPADTAPWASMVGQPAAAPLPAAPAPAPPPRRQPPAPAPAADDEFEDDIPF